MGPNGTTLFFHTPYHIFSTLPLIYGEPCSSGSFTHITTWCWPEVVLIGCPWYQRITVIVYSLSKFSVTPVLITKITWTYPDDHWSWLHIPTCDISYYTWIKSVLRDYTSIYPHYMYCVYALYKIIPPTCYYPTYIKLSMPPLSLIVFCEFIYRGVDLILHTGHKEYPQQYPGWIHCRKTLFRYLFLDRM